MFGLSERIIRNLTDITTSEGAQLPQWIDKNYVASCVVPPLSGENNVHCNIAVVAPVSAGKSTLFNSLCGYPILPVAPICLQAQLVFLPVLLLWSALHTLQANSTRSLYSSGISSSFIFCYLAPIGLSFLKMP